MDSPTALAPSWLAPIALIGRAGLNLAAYLGCLGTLVLSAIRSVLSPSGEDPPFWPAWRDKTLLLLAMGAPLVALVHLGMGTFLSMQAYFGGTFVDGTGAVVGVGLIRNVAPMMTGLTLTGLLAPLFTTELLSRANADLNSKRVDQSQALDNLAEGVTSPSGFAGSDTELEASPARLVAVRIGAGMTACLILSVWGALVGTVVGWQTAKKLLGVSTDSFFSMYFEMLWLRDVFGLVTKGVLFGLFAAVFPCHEGLRAASRDSSSITFVACRAACLASVALLFLNSIWFLLIYHAGPAFGPTLLAPPGL